MVKKTMTAINYKAYRPALRNEFLYACGYCETREPELSGSEAFHIDHYRPQSKFPHLICKYTNLIYACRYCNRSKSNYWPNFLGWVLGRIILNPRTDNFAEHIDQSGFAWQGLTTKGKWTVLKLRLDVPAFVQRRKKRRLIENVIKKLENILVQLQLGLSNAIQQNAEKLEIQAFHQDIQLQIKEITELRLTIEGRAD
jgi:hypothetical protein